MTLFESDRPAPSRPVAELPATAIDAALVAQLVVAWAGEGGESPRLRWWRTDLLSPDGGLDLFRRLLPITAEWAALQGAREAARRTDARLRHRDHDPDRLVSLFSLGFELDERLDERVRDLKLTTPDPYVALSGLSEAVQATWNLDRFAEWVRSHGSVQTTSAPAGRRLAGPPPDDLGTLIDQLVAALDPLGDDYSLPHFRRPA